MAQTSQRQNRTAIRNLILVTIYASIFFMAPTVNAKAAPVKRHFSSRALRAMARVYMAYGEYQKAQPLAEKALAYAKDNDVPESELSTCMIDLAWLYRYQGKLNQAQQFCRDGLQLQQKALGPEHPYVAYTLRTLASIHQDLAQYPLAAESLDHAVSIMRLYHGPDDRVIAPFNVDIARLLAATGSLTEAEDLYTHTIGLIKDTYGPEHLYSANVMIDMAELYVLQENYADAALLLEQAAPTLQLIYEPDNHAMVHMYLTMGKILKAKQDYEQAEQLLRKAVTILQEKYKDQHPDTAKALSALAQLYFETGKFDLAHDTCDDALKMLQNTLGPNNDHTAAAILTMAKIQIRRGKLNQAKELCQSALETFEYVFDENHPKLKPVLKTLILLHLQTADYTEAAKFNKRFQNIQQPKQIALVPVAKVLEQTNVAEKKIERDFH